MEILLPPTIQIRQPKARPLVKCTLTNIEQKVYDLTLEGVCSGNPELIMQMDIDIFNNLYQYYIGKQEISNAWKHIVNHEYEQEVKKIKSKR